MTDPIVKNIDKQDNRIELVLCFPKEAIYFQGHFPETPILPGFVQIYYAMFFAKKYWPISDNLNNIKKMKFTKIISPDFDVSLVLEKISDDKIAFKYKDDTRIYSSGEFHLGEKNE
jgi:3-hydroxymyristoyl/3-hydroxydecanoyl-(acyl carrier protein) dehydratase